MKHNTTNVSACAYGNLYQFEDTGITTTCACDGPQVIAEYEGGSPARKYIYGPGIDEPVCMITGSGAGEVKYFYYFDVLGSVAALVNTSGQIAEQYRYDAFGKVRIFDGAGAEKTLVSQYLGNPWMFTGRRYDPESGLYEYRARMYDPQLARFLQPDPIGYADSMNLYQYCGNNPVNWVDPWGLEAKTNGQISKIREEIQRQKQKLKMATDPALRKKIRYTIGALEEKIKIINDFRKWCEINPVNNDVVVMSHGMVGPGEIPIYHQCGTHALANEEWFDNQSYGYWRSTSDMRHRHPWWGLWIRQNHQILRVYPKRDYEDIVEGESFVLDSWLWDTVEDWNDWLERWPVEEHAP